MCHNYTIRIVIAFLLLQDDGAHSERCANLVNFSKCFDFVTQPLFFWLEYEALLDEGRNVKFSVVCVQ